MKFTRRFILRAALWAGLAVGALLPGVSAAETRPSTADHAKFEELQRPFASGPEVTKACLGCHTEAAKQVHRTAHWTWDYLNARTGQRLGKKRVINNFCTSTTTNMGFCAACHVGYDYRDDTFDFASEELVDCLVCHETTGTYKKLPGLAGHPNYQLMEWPPHSGNFREPPDLTRVAQSVGPTSRATCGACHFFGGGGNGVKHGDLDGSLTNPGRYLDVHMDSEGLNFSCSDCHATENHQVPGSRYAPTARDTGTVLVPGRDEGRNPATCQACHGTEPHTVKSAKLNDHTRKVACQTCHIPEFARGGVATKMLWDWSTAGRLDPDGHPYKVAGSEGRENYDSKKGDFSWERNVIPTYQWFNGKVTYTLFGDEIDPDSVVQINAFDGSPADGESMIWPVKVMKGRQPYDAGRNQLAVFHAAGQDDTAYWANFDWDKAIAAGMASRGVEYSGKLGFVETESRWPITHMVAPKEDALTCEQCHRENGRLEGVEGVYIPGRDAIPWLDRAGFALALLTLVGVLGHGLGRYLAARRRG